MWSKIQHIGSKFLLTRLKYINSDMSTNVGGGGGGGGGHVLGSIVGCIGIAGSWYYGTET